jgi:hypothetical protein
MMTNRPITDEELDKLIALSDGPSVLHWGLLNRALRELKEARWTPITPGNLPKVGDEIYNFVEQQVRVVTPENVKWAGAGLWLQNHVRHFRPINPPSHPASKEGK